MKSDNYQMRVLQTIGICFVVLGHLSNNMKTMGTFAGWFPIYSFHMPLFLFISGYFFKDPAEGQQLKKLGIFVWNRFRKFMIPFYLVNGFFILFQVVLKPYGFFVSVPYSFTEWLTLPLSSAQPSTLAIPTWYLTGLFLAEIYFYVIRGTAIRLIRGERGRELVLLIFILGMGAVAAYIRYMLQPSESIVVLLRSVVMLFFMQLGIIYRKYLEQMMERIPGGWYFFAVFAMQLLLIVFTRNNPLVPELFALRSFGRFGGVYFAAGVTGIALWLGISRLIASSPYRSRLISFTGSSTKYIMEFHVFGFFLLNTLFFWIHNNGLGKTFLAGFQEAEYKRNVFYACTDNPRMILLYFFAGMAVSLLAAYLIRFLKRKCSLLFEKKPEA